MPQSIWTRAVLAAAVGMAAWAGLARAQDIETLHRTVLNPDKPHPILTGLHVTLPMGCWASHNCYGCGSGRSEAIFIFGSCRQFWGEACLKGPPPIPGLSDADNEALGNLTGQPGAGGAQAGGVGRAQAGCGCR